MKKSRLLFELTCLSLLAACAALPAPPPAAKGTGDANEPSPPEASAPLPAPLSATHSPAVDALLAKARAQRSAGQFEVATVSLERALRIQPRDPRIWLELAQTRYAADDFGAAEQFAEKARRLAGDDEKLLHDAQRLVQAARLGGL